MDSWACLYSHDYSIALWYGYDVVTSEYYMLNYDGTLGRRRIMKKLVKQVISGDKKLLTSQILNNIYIRDGEKVLTIFFDWQKINKEK